MKKLATLILAITGLVGAAVAEENINVSGKSGIAVNGYDVVSFFSEDQPAHGDPGISATHQGAKYIFSNQENKSQFESDPGKYAPQFGGYCAYGVSVDALFPVDVSTATIRDGKLYLNLNTQVLDLFKKDLEGNISKAEKQWVKLGQ
tara:strand:- start:4334 stop:4774 length:441 start_codon:yes stop_codon:yes gene_type:complete